MWVFGYGSLLWNPGFTPAEQHRARLKDYHRSFCMSSIHHRGTPECPGLVLALAEAPGAACTGVAFRVAEGEEDEVLAYLRERELVSAAYLERHLPLRLDDGRVVEALTYVIDMEHDQFVQLSLEEQAQRIARATGGRGPNSEYLMNTAAHLDLLAIRDDDMAWLVTRVLAMRQD
ncbi:MAG: gamma-glutamylcyclotransferase [Rhodobacterales bacterium]|nr:MAG: gamma-glutamylcyclotransferase [Rhodobacterales bacterium]